MLEIAGLMTSEGRKVLPSIVAVGVDRYYVLTDLLAFIAQSWRHEIRIVIALMTYGILSPHNTIKITNPLSYISYM